jgi:hypothetical protein|tara:strand:+ start:577 stop:1230 length:654 start_codon:yes stop_codon:yes gene_type:complete
MKTRPILMSSLMVKGILDGSKTETIIEVKYNKKIKEAEVGFSIFTDNNTFEVRGIHDKGEYGISFFKMKHKVGDVLWVRESCQKQSKINQKNIDDYIYKADNSNDLKNKEPYFRWLSSFFMPKEACRLFLKIKSIEIQRIQDISELNCLKQGVKQFTKDSKVFKFGFDTWKWGDMPKTAKEAFKLLWYSINGKKYWEDNPYVFVYKFSVTKKPKDFI